MLYLSSVGISEGATVHILRVSDGEIVSTGEPSPLFTDGNYNAEYTLFKRMKEADGVALYTTVKGIMMRAGHARGDGLAVRDGEQTAGLCHRRTVARGVFDGGAGLFLPLQQPHRRRGRIRRGCFSAPAARRPRVWGRLSGTWKEALDALWSGPASGALEGDDLCFRPLRECALRGGGRRFHAAVGRVVRHSAAQAVLPVLA